MIRLKTLLREATASPLLDAVLEKAAPLIQSMMVQAERFQVEQTGRPFTKFDEQWYRTSITYDLVDAIERYTKPTDQLVSYQDDKSAKGNIEINIVLDRDGKQYPLRTEVIYAGGYNIQKLHFRYITKTSLPKHGLTPTAAAYKEKMKSMNKIEKMQEELRNAELSIKRNEEKIAAAEEVLRRTDADVVIPELQRETESKRGSKYISRDNQSLITSWKRENMEGPMQWIKNGKENIKTMQAKIAAATKMA
jgi:hypothetical protein